MQLCGGQGRGHPRYLGIISVSVTYCKCEVQKAWRLCGSGNVLIIVMLGYTKEVSFFYSC
jgi:hypothetical protein